MRAFHRDEIDGVPVVWSSLPGPMRASLTFGVGQAHETLPRHGITHLVEHLVLTGSSQAPHAYNGSTGSVFTSFVAMGLESDVVSHLAQVCDRLGTLPTERLEHERQVLRAEAAQRPRSPADALAMWRWGPVGFGLPAYEEFAVRSVAEAEVAQWASSVAGAGAALWLSGPPPAGLKLPLPAAQDWSKPAPPDLVNVRTGDLPGVFTNEDRGVAFSLIAGRGPELASAMWLLQHRLEQRLRHELGLVYGVNGGTEVLDSDHRLVLFALDCLPESRAEVQREVCELLLAASAPPTDVEWSTLVAQRSLGLQAPEEARVLHYLDGAAQSVLQSRPMPPMEEWDRLVQEVTAEQTSDFLRDALDTLVLAVPDASTVSEALAQPMPVWSKVRYDGTVLRPSARHGDKRVRSAFVGPAGVTILFDGGNAVSVGVADLAGVLCYDDGTRHLLGLDGFHARIAPSDWDQAGNALASLDRGIDSSLRIPGIEREVPQAEAAPLAAAVPRWNVRLLRVLLALFAFGVVSRSMEMVSFYGSCAVLSTYPWWKGWFLQATKRWRK